MKTKILDGMQEMQANEPERKDTRGDRNSQCTDFIRDGLLCQTTSTTLIAVQHLGSRVSDECRKLLTLHRIVGILSVFVKNKYICFTQNFYELYSSCICRRTFLIAVK